MSRTATTPSQRSSVSLPSEFAEKEARDHPLLKALCVTAAGFAQKRVGMFPIERHSGEALFIYCTDGAGWCETDGHLTTVQSGGLLVVAPETATTCGSRAASPWTIHWVRATGHQLDDYLSELRMRSQAPVVHIGEDLQVARLFGETLRSLHQGPSFACLLRGSRAFAYALALLIQKQQETPPVSQDVVKKVAQAIIYISEHLEEPLRVTTLARMANLSPAYFSALFKQETGCAPRDYLHLLRIHRACQLLQSSTLNIKQIATRLGYQDQFHFSRQFKAFQGLSPTDYRDRLPC